ncbi:MAG: 1-acyl-sn-glycerol-3-phosphate acyltransferase [Chloroflexi bacterium]|nr:1-acyl-sn-glycerol-3-phosphate acyltransferase [Chloroflexota bacterium]MBU1746417.1 1-acyl-sn-glycerol-3-phosphate acyltransferase [Chloroflexota bacterium]MBU1877633.1 1-acyl-sn-glycerol-3-phosphate acyltransferase [Chloroflexota bacterium]
MNDAEYRVSARNRRVVRAATRFLLNGLTRWQVQGAENIPPHGPLIVYANHQNHLDGNMLIAALPWGINYMATADLWDVPVTGQLLRLYGAIQLHRGAVDRTALRQAYQVLDDGGVIGIFPEGTQSPTGQLIRARAGASYVARQSDKPLLPVGLVGLDRLYDGWLHRERPRLTVVIGQPYTLPPRDPAQGRREDLQAMTELMMLKLAALLPPDYQGVYRERLIQARRTGLLDDV